MKDNIKRRVVEEANIIVATKITIRDLAKIIGVSKSTIHTDMNNRLKYLDNSLYLKVKKVFEEHIKIRHFLGGEATRKKYKKNNINFKKYGKIYND